MQSGKKNNPFGFKEIKDVKYKKDTSPVTKFDVKQKMLLGV